MTKNNNKDNFLPIFAYHIKGNLNNSSNIGCIKNNNSRALVPSSIFKPVRINFSLYMYYSNITYPAKVSSYWVIEAVNEYAFDCFHVLIFKSNKHKLGEGVSLIFSINIPLKDEKLIRSSRQVLFGDCGQLVKKKDYFNFIVKDLLSINEKIIPFFNKYNLQGRKFEAFEYWKRIAYLMSQQAHTTLDGLNEIKKIKRLMQNHAASLSLPLTSAANGENAKGEFSLVLYGSNLSSTVGSPRYTYFERASIKIPYSKMSVFIGILLSDATIQKQNKGGEARLQFKQKYGHFEYFYSVFFQLSHYCSQGPFITKTILHKKVHYALSFTTRSLLCITKLYNLFYYDGKKIVPQNLFFYLTWEAIAHWVHQKSNQKFYYPCGIRTKNVYGLLINVEYYTIKDIVNLMNILMIKFKLSCSLHTLKQNKSHIYIKNKSIPLLLNGIRPYINSFIKTNNIYQTRALSGLCLFSLECANVNKQIKGLRLYSFKSAFNFYEKRLTLVSLYQKRYSYTLNNPSSYEENNVINPWCLTGFVDGEGSFQIIVLKNKEIKTGWEVRLVFSIGLHKKDRALLDIIKDFLGVGKISRLGKESVQFRVQSIKEMNTIIEHFSNYPLNNSKTRRFLNIQKSLWTDYE